MSLTKIKNMKDERGFTLVELLIVIVIIAILAAITIVAYNGVQNRAKTSAGAQTANGIVKKFEAYNAVNSAYPTTKTQIQGTPESNIAGLPAATTAGTTPLVVPNTDTLFSGTSSTGQLTASTGNGGMSVRAVGSATGGKVYWFDYTANAETTSPLSYGAGS